MRVVFWPYKDRGYSGLLGELEKPGPGSPHSSAAQRQYPADRELYESVFRGFGSMMRVRSGRRCR
jgi:hypothetical protein